MESMSSAPISAKPKEYRGRCAHCPFNFKCNLEGATFDDTFTELDVHDWTKDKPVWRCHDDPTGATDCMGARLFLAGKSEVSKDDLMDFWVHLKPIDTAATNLYIMDTNGFFEGGFYLKKAGIPEVIKVVKIETNQRCVIQLKNGQQFPEYLANLDPEPLSGFSA